MSSLNDRQEFSEESTKLITGQLASEEGFNFYKEIKNICCVARDDQDIRDWSPTSCFEHFMNPGHASMKKSVLKFLTDFETGIKVLGLEDFENHLVTIYTMLTILGTVDAQVCDFLEWLKDCSTAEMVSLRDCNMTIKKQEEKHNCEYLKFLTIAACYRIPVLNNSHFLNELLVKRITQNFTVDVIDVDETLVDSYKNILLYQPRSIGGFFFKQTLLELLMFPPMLSIVDFYFGLIPDISSTLKLSNFEIACDEKIHGSLAFTQYTISKKYETLKCLPNDETNLYNLYTNFINHSRLDLFRETIDKHRGRFEIHRGLMVEGNEGDDKYLYGLALKGLHIYPIYTQFSVVKPQCMGIGMYGLKKEALNFKVSQKSDEDKPANKRQKK